MRICLIGATHPCHNPRLVREADILTKAGYDVNVVAPCHSALLSDKTKRLLQTRQWRLREVDFRPVGISGRSRSVLLRSRRRLAMVCYRLFGNRGCAEMAYLHALPEMKRLASAEPADWFIAHTQATLPVAAWAARCWRAKLGFDCEDLLARSTNDPVEIVKSIEREYVPRCAYVSAPSQSMANELRDSYGVDPLVLYNVFPLDLAAGIKRPANRPCNSKVRLHWFSQVIGPGRGIEDAVCALQWLSENVELHLRGTLYDSYRARLMELADRCGVASRLYFYPQVDHDALIATLAEFDIGLALERPENANYSLTITNKVFSYILAGLPVVATETQGQLEAIAGMPGVGASYPAGDAKALAERIARWSDDSRVLRIAQESAWCLARKRFCWDIESKKFLKLFGEVAYNSDDAFRQRRSICAE